MLLYPAAAAQYASNRFLSSTHESEDDSSSSSSGSSLSKREELWQRRWARAKEVLNDKGVLLRAWRVGDDVMRDTVMLVEKAGKDSCRTKLNNEN